MKRLTSTKSKIGIYVDGQFKTGHFNIWPAFFIHFSYSPYTGRGLTLEFHPFNSMLGIRFVINKYSK
jgi:hypothetical protein